MKKVILLLGVMLSFSLLGIAQDADTTATDTSYWSRGGVASVNFNNTGYSLYWQAGGIPSVAIGARVNFFFNYEKDKIKWENDIDMAIGGIRQGRDDAQTIKNDDRLELSSKLGYKLNEKLFLSSLFSFRTQFIEGYEFVTSGTTVTRGDLISDLFSPAYVNFGVGLDYQPSKALSINYTPINSKITIVDQVGLRDRYIPDDDNDPTTENDAVRYELGSNLNIKYRRDVFKNVNFSTKANFFANYLENFGSIDVNWETLTTMKVNDWLAVSFTTNLIYDEDINFLLINDDGSPITRTIPDPANPGETIQQQKQGPRTQFQHVLSVGLTYTFFEISRTYLEHSSREIEHA